jgi:8-amino-7-oxononanoate synthase
MFHVKQTLRDNRCHATTTPIWRPSLRRPKVASVSLESDAEAVLAALEARGQRRHPREISGPIRPRTIIDGRLTLCFCSNDYLGLAAHPALLQAARRALDEEGLGSGASRHISGNLAAHRVLERGLAEYTGHAAATLFATGYSANLGTLQALVGRDDLIFSDELNHASLIDGARLSRARVIIYRHLDLEDLAAKLAAHRHQGRAALVVSESLFSMDGDQAPLAELAALARRYDAGFVLDEAHALGVLGPEGRGLARGAGLLPDVTIGTLGKAFGCQGAFAAASHSVTELLRNRARSYIYSTAPSPVTSAAALGSLRLVREADQPRHSLRQHWTRLRHGLAELGFSVVPGDSAIIPVMIGDAEPTMALSEALFQRGVFVHGIRPPTVPRGQCRLRLVPMATHTDADVAEVLAAFAEARP